MEGPGLGRRGREAGLLIPLVFVKMVRGRESLSVWGGPVHRKRSTIRRGGSANPLPSMASWSSPMGMTVESRKGSTALAL